MRISIFGTGYVGLVTGACVADVGNDVVCVDIDAHKVERLKEVRPRFPNIRWGVGDKPGDAAAYAAHSIPPILLSKERPYLFDVSQCLLAAVMGVATFGMEFLGRR